MGILIDIVIEILTFNYSFRKVTEDDIGKNITLLKETEWFQQYLQDKEYKTLIIYDDDVRKVIGKFKLKKLKKDATHYTYQKKLHHIILKKSGV